MKFIIVSLVIFSLGVLKIALGGFLSKIFSELYDEYKIQKKLNRK